MFKNTLKILQNLLQDFSRAFDHLVDTRRYSVTGTFSRSAVYRQNYGFIDIKEGENLSLASS